jgi:peptidoglycan/LPS O-acetylase OafA/YrhL
MAVDMAESGAPAGPGRQHGLDHQNSLDGLRAVAALTVLAFHVAGVTGITLQDTLGGRIGSRADVAVPIFFGLSGLLLYRPWARATLAGVRRPSSAAYLWRRALRILPAYWLLVVVALVAYSPQHIDSPVTWLQWLTLTQIYDLDPWWHLPGPSGLAHMWSLSTEVAFYLLLPFLALALGAYARAGKGRESVSVRGRRLLLALGALSLISPLFNAWLIVTQQHFGMYLWLPRVLWWFTAGMAIAVLGEWARQEAGAARTFCRTLALSPGTAWLIALAAYAVACTGAAASRVVGWRVPLWENEVRITLFMVVAACIIAPAAFQTTNESYVSSLLGNPLMRFLGRISYGIFLWQFVVINIYYEVAGRDRVTFDFLPILVVCTIGTIALATVTYYVVEKPLMRLRNLVRGRRMTVPAAQLEHVPQAPVIQWHAMPSSPAVTDEVR